MRIAIISDLSPWAWAGCEELWAALAESALVAGHKVALFLDRDAIPIYKIQHLQELGLEVNMPGAGPRLVRRIRKQVSWKLGGIVAPLFPVFAGIRKFAPDVIFISQGQAPPTLEFLGELARVDALDRPYVVICHNVCLFDRPIANALRKGGAEFFQNANRMFFAAERAHQEIEHLLAAKFVGARVVRNPINLTDFNPIPMPSGSTIRIASVGRLAVPGKGHDVLLAALGSELFQDRDWMLSIYGSGPHLQYLQGLAEHYKITDRVVFKGHNEDVRAIWTENHILALPSRNEGGPPLVLAEAMICGRPSVVNDVGGTREWSSEPETGFISDGIDIDSFRDALDRAWRALPDWADIGLRAHARALKLLDPDPGGTILKVLVEVDAEHRHSDAGSPMIGAGTSAT